MANTGGRPSGSALDAALDIFRVRQYFNVAVRARDVAVGTGKDVRFLHTVRRAMLPLPFDRWPAPGQVFGPLPGAAPPPLAGRVGVVATGGSGALASLPDGHAGHHRRTTLDQITRMALQGMGHPGSQPPRLGTFVPSLCRTPAAAAGAQMHSHAGRSPKRLDTQGARLHERAEHANEEAARRRRGFQPAPAVP